MTDREFEKFRFSWSSLPAVTADLPGTGGIIRQEMDDFRVREVPLYLPEGEGSHAYARVEKRGLTTRDLVVALVRAGVAERAIGVAGLKDKYAVTEQWLSVPNRHAAAFEALAELEGVRLLETSRHRNKLGVGHLQGNRFEIRVRQAHPDALERARAILERLEVQGVPNFFGPQRFGRFGTNAIDGLKHVRGERVPGGHRLKRFFVSALQSQFFNHLLGMRIDRDLYTTVVMGDWARKHDTGGTFLVEDASAEAPRAARLEISATLPLYGKKVKVSPGVAGEMELETLAFFGLRWHDFSSRKGSRRPSRIAIGDVAVAEADNGYVLSFVLPKGSFATTLLREIMKVDVDVDAEEDTVDDE